VLQLAAEAIEAPDDERVARTEVVNARVELMAVLERPRTTSPVNVGDGEERFRDQAKAGVVS
jgi:hypothetical protein